MNLEILTPFQPVDLGNMLLASSLFVPSLEYFGTLEVTGYDPLYFQIFDSYSFSACTKLARQLAEQDWCSSMYTDAHKRQDGVEAVLRELQRCNIDNMVVGSLSKMDVAVPLLGFCKEDGEYRRLIPDDTHAAVIPTVLYFDL